MERSGAVVQGDPSVALAALASLLADRGTSALGDALELLRAEVGATSAVLRGAPGSGDLLAVAGETVHAVPLMRVVPPDAAGSVEVPVEAAGRPVAVLTVVGARPRHLPLLRAAGAVLGVALRPSPASPPATALLDLAEADADATADALHDGPVQDLVAARYAADAAARGGDPGAVREAVQTALVGLRRALWMIRPRGSGGLTAALTGLSGRLVEAGRAPLDLVVDEDAAEALPPTAVDAAYRLVQALALPLDGEPVRVRVRREAGWTVLEAEGGSPLAAEDRHTARAAALGGSLTARTGADGAPRTRLALPAGTGPAPIAGPPTARRTPLDPKAAS